MTQKMTTKKLAMAGVLTALATVGSMISFPVAGSQCAPVQHMVNILAAVTLGPGWGVGVAFCASLLRNILGIGSLMAFPGSMIGAFCCGMVYAKWKKLAPTCVAEALGTGILGGIAAYPVAEFLMGAGPAGLFVYALVTKDVMSSLLLGTFSMYILWYKTAAVQGFFGDLQMVLADSENIEMYMSFFLSGGIIIALRRSGSTKAFADFFCIIMRFVYYYSYLVWKAGLL